LEDKKFGKIIANNKHTVYGRQHSFEEIRNISDYMKMVPLSVYEDYPYTRGLQREFSSALHKWMWDLNKNFPRLKYGQFYFSITPQSSVTDGIEGFNSDDEYIGGFLGRFIAKKFCVPESVKNIQDMDMFWNTTIDYIKKARKLKFVSVWNPTFLLIKYRSIVYIVDWDKTIDDVSNFQLDVEVSDL